MTDKPRFTLQMTLRDNHGFEQPISFAVGVDTELRISPRAIDEMKAGLGSFDLTVRMMKVKEFRKDLFMQTAKRLGALLAERMEDAEGWHDASRIEQARDQIGGDWKFR